MSKFVESCSASPDTIAGRYGDNPVAEVGEALASTRSRNDSLPPLDDVRNQSAVLPSVHNPFWGGDYL
jgi:hypothetical protein